MENAELITKGPCDNCGSSDANALYTDGHTFCFSCNTYVAGDAEEEDTEDGTDGAAGFFDSVSSLDLSVAQVTLEGTYAELKSRGISKATCEKWGYQAGKDKGRLVHIANYRDANGDFVCQKVRYPETKEFRVLGTMKGKPLYGMHLWSKGKMITVTEGEIDALSVSQANGLKWPVVSVPNGAAGARAALQANLDYLDGFETVVLMFDQDEVGRAAAEECAELFAPGRCKIAKLPLKDANEMLMAGRSGELQDAVFNARPWRPDGVLQGADLWDLITEADNFETQEYPWEGLNKITRGLRTQELVTITAGSGVGKSAVVREVIHHLVQKGQKVGVMMLEESVKRTALGLMGLQIDRPLHINREGVSDAQLRQAFEATVGSGKVVLYDHFGSTEVDNLLKRMRFMAKAEECKWIILDHLSIVVSGLGDGDERRLIDNAMTMLRTFAQETGVGLIIVSHLRRPTGDRGHEEGAKVSLGQLRGSHAIVQLSDIVIGLERNQRAEGADKDKTNVVVLKNRFTGETGDACVLQYSKDTGRLFESYFDEAAEGEDPFAAEVAQAAGAF